MAGGLITRTQAPQGGAVWALLQARGWPELGHPSCRKLGCQLGTVIGSHGYQGTGDRRGSLPPRRQGCRSRPGMDTPHRLSPWSRLWDGPRWATGPGSGRHPLYR